MVAPWHNFAASFAVNSWWYNQTWNWGDWTVLSGLNQSHRVPGESVCLGLKARRKLLLLFNCPYLSKPSRFTFLIFWTRISRNGIPFDHVIARWSLCCWLLASLLFCWNSDRSGSASVLIQIQYFQSQPLLKNHIDLHVWILPHRSFQSVNNILLFHWN